MNIHCMKGTGVYDCVLFERDDSLMREHGAVKVTAVALSDFLQVLQCVICVLLCFAVLTLTVFCMIAHGLMFVSHSLHGLDPAKHLF